MGLNEKLVICILVVLALLVSWYVLIELVNRHWISRLNDMDSIRHKVHEEDLQNHVQRAREEAWADARKNQEAQNAQQAEIQKSFTELKDDTDTIALFLRQHYATEIGRGWHSNRKLGEIVTGYLTVERELSKRLDEKGKGHEG